MTPHKYAVKFYHYNTYEEMIVTLAVPLAANDHIEGPKGYYKVELIRHERYTDKPDFYFSTAIARLIG